MPTFDSSTLTSQLTECLKHLQMLEDCYMVQEKFISEFKRFLQILSVCFSDFIGNASLIFNNIWKSKIVLCLTQIIKSLKLFAALLREPLYRQGVWYVCERLRWCVSELRRVCCSSDAAEDGENDSGWFLHHVDTALQLLETQGATAVQCSSWTQLFNDIICQAVTIAKIATSIDYNEITSTCQAILKINCQLANDQLNSNQLCLLTDSLFNSLVTLEERVNVAILRLVLQVFSEPCRPVKQLVRQCGQAPSCRSLSDLDPLVAEVDAHIERVMLIGQFAVSCCEDSERVRGMKCCLASVESIDNYLIPALKALYLTPGCEDKRKFTKLLCDHWQDEANTLHSHLDNIIDSAAFCRVVQESVSDLSSRLGREEFKDEIGKSIIKQCWLLYTQLSATGVSSLDLIPLKQSLHECEATINKKVAHPAVMKRVRLVMAAVDKITDLLTNAQLSDRQPLSEISCSDSSNMVKSLQDLPLDISLSSEKSQYASYRPEWLQRKICEIKKNMLRESIHSKSKNEPKLAEEPLIENVCTPQHSPTQNVYETPKNTVNTEVDLLTPFIVKTAERNTTLYVRTPRRVVQNQMMDVSPATDCSWSTVSCSNSLALDISDILDNLSILADTLSSNQEHEASNQEPEAISWHQPHPTPTDDVMKRYFSGNSFDSQWFSLASVRTDEVSADVETPERLQDLKHVEEKIHNLKLL